MNTRLACLLLALVASVSIGQEKSPVAVTPQPRARLDPALLPSPLRTPAKSEKNAEAPGLVMDRFIVREQSNIPTGPQKLADPQGKFSVLDGGSILQRDTSKTSVAVGLWPWVDILPDDAKFRPAKTRVDMEVVRVKW